ncbi:MAG: hypothetical protein OXB84_06975 [Halobacteriovoraceae bacterium]|nr:hypothetical protein [Halobacteriovoraceae bacterium]
MIIFLVLYKFLIFPADAQDFFQGDWERSWDYYHGQGASLIEWEGLDPLRWLDVDIWRNHSRGQGDYHFWKEIYRQRKLKEMMGRVLQCTGTCRGFRGEGHVNVKWRSSIVEGDDLETLRDSYLWVFLYDGTMVRLSPNTSVTFKEINIGSHEIFYYARINYGNVLWLSRDQSALKEDEGRETDTIFLPLQFYEANHFNWIKKPSNEDLYAMVDEKSFIKEKYQRLNNLIKKNNEMIKERPSWHFITFPNGTIWGRDLRTEFIVLSGNESYVKNRTSDQLGLARKDNPQGPVFYYRGHENKEETPLDFGKWYKVASDGRKIEPVDEEENSFGLGEFVTKRIPTIFLAREMMLQRYSNFVFDDKIGEIPLALKYGYRLWGRLSSGILQDDLEKRFLFLREYTRRQETIGLLQAKQLNDRLKKRGGNASRSAYDHSYYKKALASFSRYREFSRTFGEDKRFLNSTQRSSWRRLIMKKHQSR